MGSEISTGPNARGWFGEFGGRFAPETLMAPVEELEKAYSAAKNDLRFSPSSTYCSRTLRAGRLRCFTPGDSPNALVMASASAPDGSLAPPGAIISQNIVWLT